MSPPAGSGGGGPDIVAGGAGGGAGVLSTFYVLIATPAVFLGPGQTT